MKLGMARTEFAVGFGPGVDSSDSKMKIGKDEESPKTKRKRVFFTLQEWARMMPSVLTLFT